MKKESNKQELTPAAEAFIAQDPTQWIKLEDFAQTLNVGNVNDAINDWLSNQNILGKLMCMEWLWGNLPILAPNMIQLKKSLAIGAPLSVEQYISQFGAKRIKMDNGAIYIKEDVAEIFKTFLQEVVTPAQCIRELCSKYNALFNVFMNNNNTLPKMERVLYKLWEDRRSKYIYLLSTSGRL